MNIFLTVIGALIGYAIIARVIFLILKELDIGADHSYCAVRNKEEYIGTVWLSILWVITMPVLFLFTFVIGPVIMYTDLWLHRIADKIIEWSRKT